MAKNWKQSLQPSDILSDGTPFRGDAIPDTGTIPNTNQVGQGVDWSSKTPKITTGRLQDGDTNTDVVSVSGSGYLTSISGRAQNDGSFLRVDVDGTELFNSSVREISFNTGGSSHGEGIAFNGLLYRFDSSFAVGSGGSHFDETRLGVGYVLD